MVVFKFKKLIYNFFVLSDFSYTACKDFINRKVSEIPPFQILRYYHWCMKEVDFKSPTGFLNILQTNPDSIQYSFVFTINNYL